MPGNTWGVLFDQPLRTAVLNPANWILRTDGTAWTAATATALESHVGGTLAAPGFGEFIPGANYTATPPDLASAAGVAAPAFTNFPIT